MTFSIEQFIVTKAATVKQAMGVINLNAHGICFVVDHEEKLIGVVTDGDIRRAMLTGIGIQDSVERIMLKNFTALPVNATHEAIQAQLNSKIRVIPLVDERDRPVDYASFSRLHRTPIMQPSLSGNELAYVTDCIKTGWISSQGSYVKRFEKEFADYCGAPYAVAVSNGTVALHLALIAVGIDEGDEVIVPNVTFAASINAIIHAGAVPVLADIEPETWNIDIKQISRLITSKTKAIMPVHLYGHPCRMDEIRDIAVKHNLKIIEDSAEAIGSLYKGKHVGTFSDASTFSFFGNKTITTGEGGMVLFNSEAAYRRAIILRDHGMAPSRRYWHEVVGYNYRMTNIQAAIGCAQMERIDEFVQRKRALAAAYNRILSKIPAFSLPPEEAWARCGFWLYTALLDTNIMSREDFMDKMLKNGVETRPMFHPLHQMPPYKSYSHGHKYPVSDEICRRGVSFPSSVDLSGDELRNIEEVLNQIFSTVTS